VSEETPSHVLKQRATKRTGQLYQKVVFLARLSFKKKDLNQKGEQQTFGQGKEMWIDFEKTGGGDLWARICHNTQKKKVWAKGAISPVVGQPTGRGEARRGEKTTLLDCYLGGLLEVRSGFPTMGKKKRAGNTEGAEGEDHFINGNEDVDQSPQGLRGKMKMFFRAERKKALVYTGRVGELLPGP